MGEEIDKGLVGVDFGESKDVEVFFVCKFNNLIVFIAVQVAAVE